MEMGKMKMVCIIIKMEKNKDKLPIGQESAYEIFGIKGTIRPKQKNSKRFLKF